MKKTTQMERGKVVPWKMRVDEEQQVLDWFNAQTVTVDSLRYLVQQEIALNGIRNLQYIIPQERTIETVRQMLSTAQSGYPPTSPSITSQVSLISVNQKDLNVDTSEEVTSANQDSQDAPNVKNEIVQVDESNNEHPIKPVFSMEEMESYG